MLLQVVFDDGDQIRNTGKRTAANAFLREIAKPAFYQIQPRARGRNKVQMKPGVPSKPGHYAGMFVRSVIVDDQMQVELSGSLAVDPLQKPNELLVSMTWHTIADHAAVEQAQGCKQSRGAVAFVIVRHGATTALLQRQPRLSSIQGLNLRFLVDTQDQRLIGRIQIQADNVVQLFDKPLVSAELKSLGQMGLQIMLFPDPPDCCFTQPLSLCHRAGAPVRRIRRFAMQGRFYNGSNLMVRNSRKATRARRVFFQTFQPKRQKPLAPELYRRARYSQRLRDILTRHAVSRHLNDLRPLDDSQRHASTTRPGFQNRVFLGRKGNRRRYFS